jgi:hypothetical protein
MAVVITKMYEKGILQLYATPRAPVARHINGIANTTVKLARKYVPKRTRRLQRSIRKNSMYVTPYGVEIQVGSQLRYAQVQHDGGPPHIIRPNRAKYLRFKIGGRWITTSVVHHPGNKPTRYLTRALREAVLGAPALE